MSMGGGKGFDKESVTKIIKKISKEDEQEPSDT